MIRKYTDGTRWISKNGTVFELRGGDVYTLGNNIKQHPETLGVLESDTRTFTRVDPPAPTPPVASEMETAEQVDPAWKVAEKIYAAWGHTDTKVDFECAAAAIISARDSAWQARLDAAKALIDHNVDVIAAKEATINRLCDDVRVLKGQLHMANEDYEMANAERNDLRSRLTARDSAWQAKLTAAAKCNNLPCSLCRKIVKEEFVVPSDIWNAVVRPNGRETDREYLCLDCWYVSLRKWMVSHGFVQQQDRQEVDVLVQPREVESHPRDCACATAGGSSQESRAGQAANVRDRCGVHDGGAKATATVAGVEMETAEQVAERITLEVRAGNTWTDAKNRTILIISARDSAWQADNAKTIAAIQGRQQSWNEAASIARAALGEKP